MNRREFLGRGVLSAAVVLVPGAVMGALPGARPGSALEGAPDGASPGSAMNLEPYLELQGGPGRQSCSGLVQYGRVPFGTMAEDITRHRMPSDWRDRILLGIDDLG